MASEITQVLPLALGQLVNQNQVRTIESRATTGYSTAREIAQITQIAAAQSIAKVKGNDKDRSVQTPKRAEPNFAAKNGDEKDGKKREGGVSTAPTRKHQGDLDIVA